MYKDLGEFRIQLTDRAFTVQDLATGRWARAWLKRLADGTTGLEQAQQDLAPLLPHLAELSAPEATSSCLTADELIGRIAALAPRRRPARYPIPSVSEVQAVVARATVGRPYGANLDADATSILMVATSLAYHGGAAGEFQVEEDLLRLLPDLAAVRLAMSTALARSCENITRVGCGSHALWKLAATW